MEIIFDNEKERQNSFPKKESISFFKRMKSSMSSMNLCNATIKSSSITYNDFNENEIPSFQSLLRKNKQDIELRNSDGINNLIRNYPDCSLCFRNRRIQSLE